MAVEQFPVLNYIESFVVNFMISSWLLFNRHRAEFLVAH